MKHGVFDNIKSGHARVTAGIKEKILTKSTGKNPIINLNKQDYIGSYYMARANNSDSTICAFWTLPFNISSIYEQ